MRCVYGKHGAESQESNAMSVEIRNTKDIPKDKGDIPKRRRASTFKTNMAKFHKYIYGYWLIKREYDVCTHKQVKIWRMYLERKKQEKNHKSVSELVSTTFFSSPVRSCPLHIVV